MGKGLKKLIISCSLFFSCLLGTTVSQWCTIHSTFSLKLYTNNDNFEFLNVPLQISSELNMTLSLVQDELGSQFVEICSDRIIMAHQHDWTIEDCVKSLLSQINMNIHETCGDDEKNIVDTIKQKKDIKKSTGNNIIIHMSRTAGSSFNKYLIDNYLNICGNKGHFKLNEVIEVSQEHRDDLIYDDGSKPETSKWVSNSDLIKISDFNECDVIMNEEDWFYWNQFSTLDNVTISLPCRDPLEHLSSLCHFLNIDISDGPCSDIFNKCCSFINQFSINLLFYFRSSKIVLFDYKRFDLVPELLNLKRNMSSTIIKNEEKPHLNLQQISNNEHDHGRKPKSIREECRDEINELTEQISYYTICKDFGIKDKAVMYDVSQIWDYYETIANQDYSEYNSLFIF